MIEQTDISEDYKATELGVLPNDWEITNLGDITKIRGGYGFSPDFQGNLNEKYPFFKVSDMNSFGNETGMISSNNYVSEEVVIKIGAKTFPKNTIIFPKVGGAVYTNKKRILVTDSLIDNNLMGVTSISEDICSPDFLLFYFQTLDLKDISNPGPLPSINAQRVKSLKIPLPPLPEQHTIATTLRTVQEAKEKTDAVIAAIKALKAAMMKHLFTYGPVPPEEAERVALKETEIGPVPEDWEISTLGNISKISSGGTPSRTEPSYWNGEIPWIRTGEINYSIIEKTEEKITQAGLENSPARIVPKGTLLMAMYGEGITRGRVGITGIDASINQAVAAIFPLEKMLTPFLYYYLEFSYEKNRLLGHGAHQRNLSATIIKTIFIPIPSVKTQHQIIEILTTIDQKLAAEQSRKEALDTLFTSLLHDLMTAKIRVNQAAV